MATRQNKTPWTAEEIALLGTMTDGKLADQIRRPRTTVMMKRRKLGIPAFTPQVSTIWSAAQLQLLEHNDDLRVAQLTGKLIAEVQAKRAEVKG